MVNEVRASMVPSLLCFSVGNGIVLGGLRERSHGVMKVSLVTRKALSVNSIVCEIKSAAIMA